MIQPQEVPIYEKRRFDAVQEYCRSIYTQDEVAAHFRVNPRTLRRWLKRYRDQGEDGLKARHNDSSKSRMSERQKDQLTKILLKGALASGFDTDMWTCPRVTEVVKKEFGISYHHDHIRRILHELGWSVQRPQRQAMERDEKAVQDWLHYKWPRIKKKLKH